MTKLILWLARVFKVNIEKTVEKIVYRDKIVYISLENEVNGNVTVAGDLDVKGYLYVDGDVTCFKRKGK